MNNFVANILIMKYIELTLHILVQECARISSFPLFHFSLVFWKNKRVSLKDFVFRFEYKKSHLLSIIKSQIKMFDHCNLI